MPDEQVTVRKVRGQCDICGSFTWVYTQILGGITVAAQCKRCDKNLSTGENEDDDDA